MFIERKKAGFVKPIKRFNNILYTNYCCIFAIQFKPNELHDCNKDDLYHVGLTDDEVRKSRTEHGVNLLTPPKRPSLWKLYLEKFEDPVVRVLLVAAFFSLIISIVENEYAETIGIIAAILLATGIGFFFEYDANKKV